MARALCALVLVSLAVFIAPGSGTVHSAYAASIDPAVVQDTANDQSGNFLVVLKTQANVRAFARLRDRTAQGRGVLNALRQAADSSQAAVREQLGTLGAKYRAYWIVNLFAVEGGRAVVDAMAARPDVAAIESDRAFRVPLEQPQAAPRQASGIEWNVNWVGAPAVWQLGDTGQETVYANADTGVQWDHPALKPHYRGWNGTTADHNYNWWDAIKTPIVGGSSCGYNSATPCDDYGHGTHTMGTGIGDDGAGHQIGVAPGAKWIACRNMDDGVGRPSTYIDCMQFFLAPTDLQGNNPDPTKRPDAVGNSYGCPLGPPPQGETCDPNSLQTAMETLRDAGVFMAVSAGNAGPSCSTVNDPPALEASAITVGATGYMTDTIAGFSSRGPVTVDGSNRMKPELAAPGGLVYSSIPGNNYATMSGTSMASPHVAAAVALLWSAFPGYARDVNTTESVLEKTAVGLTTTDGCGGDSPTQIPNNVYGYGRLDILAAYNYMASNPLPPGSPASTPTPFGVFLPFIWER